MALLDRRPFIVTFKPRTYNVNLVEPELNQAGVVTAHAIMAFGPTDNPEQVAARPYMTGEVPYYISPLLGATSFLTSPSVSLDNCQIQRPDVNWHLYEALCYIFCTDEVREEMFGQKTDYPRNGSDAEWHNEYRAAVGDRLWHQFKNAYYSPMLKRMCYESLGCVEGNQDYVKTARGNFSGLFPLCLQNATLRSHTGVKNDNLFLPAGCHIEISCQKMNPLNAMIERADENEQQYFSPERVDCPDGTLDQGKAEGRKSQLDIRDLEVSLAYEVAELEREISDHNFGGFFDFPIERINYLLPGVRHDSQTISVPEHSRLFYCAFIPDVQVNLSMRPNRRQNHLSTKFSFPHALQRIRFKLTDSNDLVVKDGIYELGSARDRARSPTLRMYHESLIEENIYSGRFEDWCPQPRMSNRTLTDVQEIAGYDQAFAFLLDKFSRHLTKASELTVNLEWAVNSPHHLYLYTWFVQQRRITRTKNEGWKIQVVPVRSGGGAAEISAAADKA